MFVYMKWKPNSNQDDQLNELGEEELENSYPKLCRGHQQ